MTYHVAAFRITEIHPGHGRISGGPEQDIARAIENAQALLWGEQNVEVFHETRGRELLPEGREEDSKAGKWRETA